MSLDQKEARACRQPRRQFLIGSAVLGAAVLLPGAARAADVRALEGKVRVNGKPATRTTRVRPGDVIETGPNSKLVFVVGQDAFLLREQSRLNLDKSKAGKEAVIAGLRLVTGALLAVFGPGQRRIETTTATAGIRGTGVYLEASAEETYFCTCYGEVELRDKARKERKLVLSGYHTPNMIYGSAASGKTVAPADVKDHTDDELIMLEALVGRTSPVVKRNQKLKEAGEAAKPDAAPTEPAKQVPPEQQAVQPKPQAQKAEPMPQPKPAASEPLPAAAPTPPVEPVPKAAPKPETPPSELEWRLPPPRLN
jgi:hypothetical protein